jgi:hypothetical protein
MNIKQRKTHFLYFKKIFHLRLVLLQISKNLTRNSELINIHVSEIKMQITRRKLQQNNINIYYFVLTHYKG